MAWIPGVSDAVWFWPKDMRIAMALDREFVRASQSLRHEQAGLYEELGGNLITPQRRLGSLRRLPTARTSRRGIDGAPEV